MIYVMIAKKSGNFMNIKIISISLIKVFLDVI